MPLFRALALTVVVILSAAAPSSAQERPVVVDGTIGYTGLVDDATDHFLTVGGAVRAYLTPRVSVGPEVRVHDRQRIDPRSRADADRQRGVRRIPASRETRDTVPRGRSWDVLVPRVVPLRSVLVERPGVHSWWGRSCRGRRTGVAHRRVPARLGASSPRDRQHQRQPAVKFEVRSFSLLTC